METEHFCGTCQNTSMVKQRSESRPCDSRTLCLTVILQGLSLRCKGHIVYAQDTATGHRRMPCMFKDIVKKDSTCPRQKVEADQVSQAKVQRAGRAS